MQSRHLSTNTHTRRHTRTHTQTQTADLVGLGTAVQLSVQGPCLQQDPFQ